MRITTLRFANGQRQQDPVLDRFATHIKKAHELWPLVGANAIVCATLDSMTALYIEYTTETMTISHHAKRYSYHLRLMSGISSPFAYFMFSKTWRDNVNSYLQFKPDLVFFINCSNDLNHWPESEKIMSIEVIDAVDRIKAAVAADSELATVCDSFFNGVVEFHIKTPRYCLNELGFSA
ncbi:hypothetical protein A0H81_04739 [Grifola frondosa]|uniref:Uncharacterized protein n=1 Tax=Grifola frondosa TaxID=5627 RepID=A0A1C7MLU4_GRIFR|nr:hypothetical protein A0H81_04739 [Grifola frondosa]